MQGLITKRRCLMPLPLRGASRASATQWTRRLSRLRSVVLVLEQALASGGTQAGKSKTMPKKDPSKA